MIRFFFTLTLLFSVVSSPLFAADVIGTTQRASGDTTVMRLDHIYSQRKSDPVFWRDELRTGAASRLSVRFADNTKLYMGDHSTLVIDEMVYSPGEAGKALFTLSQGVFRMVSGAINKTQGSEFTVRTPLATIGVRGTDFWGHQSEGKLTMALLDDGELHIQAGEKTIILTNPNEAIVIEKDKPVGDIIRLSDEQINQAKKTIE